MRLVDLFLPKISKFSLKRPRFRSPLYEAALSSKVLTILDTKNPIEPALEPLVTFISPDIISYVLRERPNSQLGFRFFIWSTRRRSLQSWTLQDLVIEMLNRDGGFDLYWRTLTELKSCGILVMPGAFLVLIEAYAEKGMIDKAVEVFGMMKDFDCNADVFTYNRIMHVIFRKKVFLLPLAIYTQMVKSKCSPNHATFSILIDGLSKCGKSGDALKLFDDMIHRDISPNRIIYTVVISGLCQAKQPDYALKLFYTMRESGCGLDVIICNALINGFCKLGMIDRAFSLLGLFLKDGFVLGLAGHSCLIDGLFRAGRYDEAHAWYVNMLQGIYPDVVLYTIIIRGLIGAGKFQDALKLLREMEVRGFVPDTYSYNAIIKGFCDMGLLDEARSLQLEISNSDCFPNACTYTILICGMCRSGMVGEAQEIFKEMEKHGCFPSVVTFNALIDGLCKAGNLEEAQLLFHKMEIGRNPSLFLRLSQGANQVLDSASLQSMVEKLCESGLILKAYMLLVKLSATGVLPDTRTYNILINGFCKAGNISGAWRLLKELQLKGLSPDSVTYRTLIDGLQRDDREDDAFALFDQMVKSGCPPSAEVYRSLMTWSCRKRKVSLSFSLWLQYLRNLPQREEKAIKEVEKHFEKGEVEKGVRLLLKMDFKLNDFDLGPYTVWIIGLCQVGKVEEAFKIYSVLNEYKVTVTPPSCVILITALCNEGDLAKAADVFLYSIEKGFELEPRICNNLLRSFIFSRDKKQTTFHLVSKMRSVGYDLDYYLHESTKHFLELLYNRQENRNSFNMMSNTHSS